MSSYPRPNINLAIVTHSTVAVPAAPDAGDASVSALTFPLATGVKRVLAYLIDLALLYVYMIALFMASMALDSILPFHYLMGESYLLRHAISFFTLTFPLVITYILMENGHRQGTFGKFWMKLRVVRVDGGRASLSSLTIRNVIKFLPWEIAHTHFHLNPEYMMSGVTTPLGWVLGVGLPFGLVFVYAGMIFFRTDRRAPYELLSGTHVVSTKKLAYLNP